MTKTKTKNKKPELIVSASIPSAASYMPQGQESQHILRDRAAILAGETVTNLSDANTVTYVHFRLGENERYGIPYQYVNEVMHNVTITKVPEVPKFIAGVVNRRGTLITVIDLREYFHMPSGNQDQGTYIIIVSYNDITMGMLVDSLEGSDSYDSVELSPSLHSSGVIKSEYIAGLHRGKTAIIEINQVMMDCEEQLNK